MILYGKYMRGELVMLAMSHQKTWVYVDLAKINQGKYLRKA